MKPIISVEGLGKKYTIRHEGQGRYRALREEIFKLPQRLFQRNHQDKEEFWALKDVSFDVMPGDRVGIIGRNGAGKSTLLKHLSRITEPSTGKITLRGRIASLLEVGTGFHPELTGRENIFLNGAILGMSRAEVHRKFDEIVDFAGVEKFLDTPVKRYSSGMYVRLAFAVAAHLEPEILIVDEVLAVGDAEFQKKCLGKMEQVGKEGRTVLFVSHNMAAIQRLCTVGLFFQQGKCTCQGSISKIIDMYMYADDINLSCDGLVDLQHINRHYIEKIFKNISLKNINNKNTNVFQIGDSLYIDIELTNAKKEYAYCIAILSSNGTWITSYATWMYDIYKDFPKKLSLKIDRLLLSPGRYFIYLSATNHTAGQYIDRLENAIFFEISESDFFETGKLFSSDCGICILPGHLALE